MYRVIVADDHDIVRLGYQRILSATKKFEIVGEANNCNELLPLCRTMMPDIVILDVSMPGQGVVSCIQRIKKINTDIQILIATMFGHEGLAQKCFEAGTTGFITKSSNSNVMLRALDYLTNKKLFIDPDLAKRVALSSLGRKFKDKGVFTLLSPREFDVFLSFARGESLEEISREMHLSRKTVANYRAKIKKSLGVSTTASFVHLAIKEGLLKEGLIN